MASVSSSQGWESAVDAPEIDAALLMALLEDSQLEETEDERMGCIIQSLEPEIDHNAVGGGEMVNEECNNYVDRMDYGSNSIGLDEDQYCSRSMCHIDDPFDWVDMDVVLANPHCDEMGNWYVDSCTTNEFEMHGFVDGGDFSPFYYGDSSIDHAYSPLWQ